MMEVPCSNGRAKKEKKNSPFETLTLSHVEFHDAFFFFFLFFTPFIFFIAWIFIYFYCFTISPFFPFFYYCFNPWKEEKMPTRYLVGFSFPPVRVHLFMLLNLPCSMGQEGKQYLIYKLRNEKKQKKGEKKKKKE
eukprot:TRINITY_DN3355_c2_g1_i2.p2 TRINITY_DN3355_c2_g1~~TRINITY_DN3355_c2_g1_i2.p2  ORF type:complete len:135 (+),score=7.32 TRINITY_DN3355_c2_g1_i2:108-512(+)